VLLPLRITVPEAGSTGAPELLLPGGFGRRVPGTPAMRGVVAGQEP
jgi:hypothetical protein